MMGICGIHYDDPLSVDSVMAAAKGGRRPATAVGGSAQKVQNLVVKQQLYNQTVRLRQAFLRQDGRITGTIPRYMLAPCLKAGGLELNQEQTKEAGWKFMTGEGRFNWINFCEHIEKARAKSWSEAGRVKSAKAFADIDRDGSGRLSRDELEDALKRWKVPLEGNKLDELVTACDADGDGNISYPEFVDGLARDLVAPTSIWGARWHTATGYLVALLVSSRPPMPKFARNTLAQPPPYRIERSPLPRVPCVPRRLGEHVLAHAERNAERLPHASLSISRVHGGAGHAVGLALIRMTL